ncbi:MAG: cupredoxin domain-containing protein [Actinobacteria bacterium]|nr:cupredoxin domain-containing protein [Actinomycetota bacterium]
MSAVIPHRVRPRLRALAAAGAAVLLAIGLSGCGSAKPAVVPSDTGVEPAVTVHVTDNRFDPATVEIAPGQAVRWVFEGPGEHDVVAGDGSFVSELVTSGEYVHVFEKAGQFPYDCSIHPEMVGSVTVK